MRLLAPPLPTFHLLPCMTKPSFKTGSPGNHCQHTFGAQPVLTTLALWSGVLIPLLPGPYGLTQITLLMPGYSCWKLWIRFIKQINAPPWRRMSTFPFTVPSLQYLSLWWWITLHEEGNQIIKPVYILTQCDLKRKEIAIAHTCYIHFSRCSERMVIMFCFLTFKR